jgi:hypothetical protein
MPKVGDTPTVAFGLEKPMGGILPDNPNATPPEVPKDYIYVPGRLPWFTWFPPKPKRPGRPRKLWLFPKVVLHWCRNGGTLEEAYRAVAEEHYGAVDPAGVDYGDDWREHDKAQDRYDAKVAAVKRQAVRERAFARELDALDRARERGGVLGK